MVGGGLIGVLSSMGMMCGSLLSEKVVRDILLLACLVLWMLDHWVFMCPLVEATGCGGHLRNCFVVNDGERAEESCFDCFYECAEGWGEQ